MYMLLLLFQKKDKDAKSSASFIIPPDQADKYKPLQNRVSPRSRSFTLSLLAIRVLNIHLLMSLTGQVTYVLGTVQSYCSCLVFDKVIGEILS